ncbi:hypothetical protein EYF80_039908 [Liparis tanakae]|uniref:Uncharacterized protein n=1 Tax=Liparis tanakae TaxID=230148 RepID=A0A4Z2G8J3_9TELE|nr:hypothetical protein EYF80_039908 [Liparis tanakae]
MVEQNPVGGGGSMRARSSVSVQPNSPSWLASAMEFFTPLYELFAIVSPPLLSESAKKKKEEEEKKESVVAGKA